MSNIADARGELEIIADALDAKGLTAYANMIRRVTETQMRRERPSGQRKQSQSTKMTGELVRNIKQFMRLNPDKSHSAVAAHWNVNSGRITEIIQGKHDDKL